MRNSTQDIDMVLELDGTEVMEYLWSQLIKTPDGRYVRYALADIDSLWWMGFVDTEKYSLKQWRQIFEPYKREGGIYILSKDEFLALDKYRFKGEIKIPFDAMQINEGKYTDEGLQELFDLSIAPSCAKSQKEMKQFLDDLKKRHRQPDDLIKIAREAKLEIRDLIDSFPSPLRNLELTFDQMLESGVDQEMWDQMEADDTARATSEAARQVSKFSAAPTTRSEVEANKLKGLQKARPKATPKAKPEKEKEKEKKGTELKKIRRSRRGVRG
jgi:hypothetical protein